MHAEHSCSDAVEKLPPVVFCPRPSLSLFLSRHSDGAEAERVHDLRVVFAALAELLHGQLLVVVHVHAREDSVSLLARALAALLRQRRPLKKITNLLIKFLFASAII
jgi:hypothetical protein